MRIIITFCILIVGFLPSSFAQFKNPTPKINSEASSKDISTIPKLYKRKSVVKKAPLFNNTKASYQSLHHFIPPTRTKHQLKVVDPF